MNCPNFGAKLSGFQDSGRETLKLPSKTRKSDPKAFKTIEYPVPLDLLAPRTQGLQNHQISSLLRWTCSLPEPKAFKTTKYPLYSAGPARSQNPRPSKPLCSF
ncbi:uncharacterized protein ZBAI_09928 [Zygosaccharomyces bailii ISA1307]|nr:uncharacterized protein ZBAI_09928 [Zygosaccharomyces bailii ISA1307]